MVDEEKLDKKSYIILIKRTNKPISQKALNDVIKREIANDVEKIGIEIINSIFTHGSYDYIIFLNAPDIRVAKGYIELFSRVYEGYISEVNLMEKMFTAVNCGITNPEIEKLNVFFKV